MKKSSNRPHHTRLTVESLEQRDLPSTTSVFTTVSLTSGILHTQQRVLDVSVQSFRVLNNSVYDLHTNGILEAMNINGSGRRILAVGINSFALDGAGWVVALDRFGNLEHWSPSSSQGIIFATGVRKFVADNAGNVFALTLNGNAYRYAPGPNFTGVLIGTNISDFQLINNGATVHLTPKATVASPAATVASSTATSKYTPFLSAQDISLIRAHPDQIGTVFAKYESSLIKVLGAGFAGLSEEGLKAAFASITAYQMAGYLADGDPSPKPSAVNLSALLAVRRLACNTYSELATLLFRQMVPQAAQEGIKVYYVGWQDGAVGNHVQLFVTGVGVPLLLDPTTDIIARTDFTSVVNHQPVNASWIVRPYVRIDNDPYVPGLAAHMEQYALTIQNALVHGQYRLLDLVCLIDTDAWIPLAGVPSTQATVGVVNGSLYVLGPNVPSNYADLSRGAWISVPSGMTSFGYHNWGTASVYFVVADGDGDLWHYGPTLKTWY